MSWLSQIAGFDIAGITKSVGDAIDEIHTSDEELINAKGAIEKVKTEAKLKTAEILESSIVQQLKSREGIIRAEMAQGDRYTKWARPTVVYSGILLIFLTSVILPMVGFYTGREVPALVVPQVFWGGWTIVISVWSTGRTSEKKMAMGFLAQK